MEDYEDVVLSLEDNPENLYLEASKIILDISNRILHNISNLKIRKLPLSGAELDKLFTANGAIECLFCMGFVEDDDNLILPEDTSLDVLKQITQKLTERRQACLQKNMPETSRAISKPEATNKLENSLPEMIFTNQFLRKIEHQFRIALKYQNEELLKYARSCIPLADLELNAMKNMRSIQKAIKLGQTTEQEMCIDELLLLELLNWFKNTFFKWVNTPPCDTCSDTTVYIKTDIIDNIRVEVYECPKCKVITTFPRYNDPAVLLKTRKGRCGEWANVFTLLCCALGWDARFILDETDHVWTEVFSITQNRWLHCDPCEAACDTPLMYEVGWGKQLSYVIAYSPYELQDVTWRYSRNHALTLSRRNQCSEDELVNAIISLRQRRQASMSKVKRDYLNKRIIQELVELMQERQVTEGEKIGRQSGSLAWRLARGETGDISDTVPPGYIWKPTEESPLFLQVQYNTKSNLYQQIKNDGHICKTVEDWRDGACDVKSLFRKEEHDWKIAYIARKEGNEDGFISWKFASASEKNVIDKVEITFRRTVYENGKIDVRIKSSNQNFEVTDDRMLFTISNFPNQDTEITLEVRMTGGKGDVAWQHAQLFRQSMETTEQLNECPFIVTIHFKQLQTV